MHTAKTKLLAVIGNPIEHSMSPMIHGAAIRESDIDFAYVAFRVDSGPAAISAMRSLGIRGFSVTIPHKETILASLDRLDVSARCCGSCNTVVNDDGVLTGYSTDGPGAVSALRAAGVDPSGRAIRIIGTGGAARAISFALADAGAVRLSFQSVEPAQAAKLKGDLESHRHGIVAEIDLPFDLLINASPLGMHPHVDTMPVDAALLRPPLAVFDIVYNPLRTRLLREAADAGCVTVDGVGMFAEQAALQFELFTGTPAPRALMRKVVREELEKKAGA